ncbi:MAG: chorismate mutase [candidate division Zixibacteria bacterium]|nr:chorismate mutase [candidate division Zixibacteria bacterium]
MAVRGIRGAIQVPDNTVESIDEGTRVLLRRMVEANNLATDDIISIFLTATVDLDADYPAAAARAMGWTHIPLLDAQEVAVQGGMPRVIRVLMHVETNLTHRQIHHAYLGDAARLRPDLAGQ